MLIIEKLQSELSKFHLLNHDFYKAWAAGLLSLSTLQNYASLYYKHVKVFPRYISCIHSLCNDIKARQVLLENLVEEEMGDENHPELWLRFCDSLFLQRIEVEAYTVTPAIQNLIDGFFAVCRSSYAEGLGALFAYEHQVPAIAQSKIDGLRKFYNYSEDNPGLQFFKVHINADEWHTAQCVSLIANLDAMGYKKAIAAALNVAELLWQFLDSLDYRRENNLENNLLSN